VSLEPLHPDEVALHHQLRNALNRALTSTDFFVWIAVEPSGERAEYENLAGIVGEAEQWLSGLNPDEIDADDLPTLPLEDKAGRVEIRAIPKRTDARGRRPAEVVGNPEPALAGWLP
jgi:hypothetical protein